MPTSKDLSNIVATMGVSNRAIARHMGLSGHSLISDRMAGLVRWQLDEIDPLASALNMTTDELWERLRECDRLADDDKVNSENEN